MDNKHRVAIYVRLSKEDVDSGERESESIQNQKSMLLKYALKQEWQVTEIYCDEDYSGAYAGDDNKRPQFRKMISDAEKHKFDIVLCKSQSRFSRNMEVIEQYIHGRFIEWGIRFIGLVDNADTDVRGNKKARQINSLINEWYLEDLSDNIKAVFKDKMQRGEYLASFPPYGYSKDKDNKNHLIPNPKTAPVVKQIFDWHEKGFGSAKIAQMLNDRNIPNPRKQQELDGLRKTYMYKPDEPGIWSTTSVQDILNNQVYCGDVVQHVKEKVSYKSKVVRKVAPEKRIIIPDMHEPLISRETFEKTQKRLRSHRRADGTGMVHILSGKVFCHYCGRPMQKTHSETTKGRIDYMRCREKYSYSAGDRCPTPNVRLDAILESLQIELINKFKDIEISKLDDNTVRRILTIGNSKERLLADESTKLQEEKNTKELGLENLYADRLNGIITLEQYKRYSAGFNKRIEEIDARLKEIEEDLAAEATDAKVKNVKEGIKRFLETRCIDRQIINSLVDRIEFGEINPKTNKPIMKIYWAWE